jgi:D-beta-D-heptose 7-phosphate kinase/D-beta-D-heptose 1-phosphate adenosyltransferase
VKVFTSTEKLNAQLKEQANKKIVFTNGVFDIIHPGHIELFQFARKQGDILVVGINDDLSVKRLKGMKRPIFPLEERIEILTAIQYINFVIPFSEDTPLELIKKLYRIDILVKGADYSPSEVVGGKEVTDAGGRLILFNIKSKISSSSIIKKILS